MSVARARQIVALLEGGIANWREKQELCQLLPPILDDAEAWRKGAHVLNELQERVIPCGHRIEDLIGGEGHVTKCGACLAARATFAEVKS
ncbi:MAG: hypothetical protein IPM54_24900 [Polyangiaceae bacterium]|nr:hypothetical protein [Polyangiaceae bacterium]